MIGVRRLLFSCLLLVSSLTCAESVFFADRPGSEKYVVILSGAAAEPHYRQRFRQWSTDLLNTLRQEYQYPADNVRLLVGDGETDDAGTIAGACTLESLTRLLSDLEERVKPDDQITFILIGHGTGRDSAAKFNLVGPDITGQQFAAMLSRFSAQDIIVINTTSSSHPFTRELSAPGRVLISSTRSGVEKYDTIFPLHFIDALANHAADRDKNKRLSAWEAFIFTAERVNSWYQEQGRLATEHASLNDNGDAFFSTSADSGKDDGTLAQVAFFDTLNVPLDDESIEVMNLRSAMNGLEREIILLRNRKLDLEENDYYLQLEQLLIDLARTTRAFNRLQVNSRITLQ
ncbi:MAG: hypothetical protein QGI68_03015 [Pseudomonadales bacterium]|jgi:hypothetical protein|nr:hypothetical protein [Pseudomonadales bacterium]MDP7594524.1 hypothetical protein [Pseudomonadales bacterium]HJN50726.1 hypothetical protein [Pseudomonadales bacterium]|tara:strand:- start:1367 stop:2404 length:1038 start_codon:yes stop_codon:yes gene_type:complete